MRREQKKMEKEGGRRIVLGREEIARGRPKGGGSGRTWGFNDFVLARPRVRWLPMAQWAQRLEKRIHCYHLQCGTAQVPMARRQGARLPFASCQLATGERGGGGHHRPSSHRVRGDSTDGRGHDWPTPGRENWPRRANDRAPEEGLGRVQRKLTGQHTSTAGLSTRPDSACSRRSVVDAPQRCQLNEARAM